MAKDMYASTRRNALKVVFDAIREACKSGKAKILYNVHSIDFATGNWLHEILINNGYSVMKYTDTWDIRWEMIE